MAEDTRAFFESLSTRGYEPLLHRVSGSYRVDIDRGDGNWQIWRVAVDHGALKVSEDTSNADCIIKCSQEEFDRLVHGHENVVAAFLQGQVEVEGNLGLAQSFQRLVH
ncbi:MAG: hypothetical protein OJF49_004165 [Ktedonobacterales bacterium]|nr:MAG: hypothetical protein OJF49_004165 [Ktedonobacterales bacterium]